MATLAGENKTNTEQAVDNNFISYRHSPLHRVYCLVRNVSLLQLLLELRFTLPRSRWEQNQGLMLEGAECCNGK